LQASSSLQDVPSGLLSLTHVPALPQRATVHGLPLAFLQSASTAQGWQFGLKSCVHPWIALHASTTHPLWESHFIDTPG